MSGTKLGGWWALGLGLVLAAGGAHADPKVEWSRTVNQDSGVNDFAAAAALTSSNDLVSVGQLGGRFAVIKQAGSDGATLWTALLPTSQAGAFNQGTSVRIAKNDDVFAAGAIKGTTAGADLTVVRLAKADGAPKWTQTLDGSAGQDDLALALALDQHDDVVAVGYVTNVNTQNDFAVLKLAGKTGQVLWKRMLAVGHGAGFDAAYAVAVGPDGDPVAVGTVWDPDAKRFELVAAKLSGKTGDVVWFKRYPSTVNPTTAEAVAFAPGGDPVVAGTLDGRFTVTRLRHTDGTKLWQYQHSVASASPPSVATTLVITDSVTASGFDGFSGEARPFVARLTLATGAPVWEHAIGAKASSWGALVATVTASGEVLAPGSTGGDAFVLRLKAQDGDQIWKWKVAASDRRPAAAVLKGNALYVAGSAMSAGGRDLWTLKLTVLGSCVVGTKLKIECACKCGKFEHCDDGVCYSDHPADPGGEMHKAKPHSPQAK